MIGGVGQKFSRPYSIIGYMAHKITFDPLNGNLIFIERISMNNVVPVNIQSPLKIRESNDMNVVQNGRNRHIYLF